MSLKKIIGESLQLFFSFFPIKENKIMFETGTGEIKDHLKAIYEYSKENDISDYDFKWAVNRGVDVSELGEGEVVYKKTLSYYYHLMTSKYWMRTHSVENIVKKRDGQIYIQLWHGPGATKKEGYDMGTIENKGETMPHAKEWDYFIATDWPNREYIKTALNLKIPRLLIGSSRSDVLVNMDKDMYYSIRKNMGINEGEKVVLYAPTFRENDFNLEKIDLKIKELCRLKGVRVILRLHPEVKNRIDISDYDNTVIDGNTYTDIYLLYMAADILITDYSSVSIEYALLRRPILFYMYDLEEYKSERNFYFDYLDHLAGPVIKTEEELIHAVQHIDEIQENFKEEYQAYHQRYNEKNDGHVCERFMKLLQSGFFSKPGNDITT